MTAPKQEPIYDIVLQNGTYFVRVFDEKAASVYYEGFICGYKTRAQAMKALEKLKQEDGGSFQYGGKFDAVHIGSRVYDVLTNRYGRVSDVRETAAEWVDAFVTWDDKPETEEVLGWTPNYYIVTE